MTRSSLRVHSVVLAGWCLAATSFAPAAADDVQPITIRRPVPLVGAERTYWIGTGATEEEAMALREALVAAGTRNVNLFVPDMVIVGDVPPAVAADVARVATPVAFRAQEARDLRVSAVADASWGWIVESYALADRVAQGEGADALAADADHPDAFSDVVLTNSPARVEEIQRQVQAARALDVFGTRPAVARRANQNSEFLAGYILANFVYPESNGLRDLNTENWTDDDLRQAKAGATAAFVSWQGKFPNMDIAFVIHHFERIETDYEPISHDMDTDGRWIVDTIHQMGWGLSIDEAQPVVHEFNEAERVKWRTQWVVTSFIATSRNTPGNRFKNGTAPYTAYAYLGGPYMVEPFPAGSDPNQVGETLVYSQIVSHEIGHMFYTLDEYPNSPGTCQNRSGYLNEENLNQTMTQPGGGEARCIPHVPCIMHSAARLNQNRPWCDWSQGQLGVLDGNGNAIPDIFEAEPQITFVPEGPETVTTDTYTLRFKAKATAVPNMNPMQGDQRASYTLPLDEGKLIFGNLQIGLDPIDGTWNEIEEEVEYTLTTPQAGLQINLLVRVENEAGYRSTVASKTVYFVGIRYSRVATKPLRDIVVVSWETTGETFGARFDLYRLNPGQPKPGRLVAQDVRPYDTSHAGEPMYHVYDTDVTAGTDYRYYIEGVFDLPQAGGTREFRSQSQVVAQTAMIQLIDIVSNVAPNPTRGGVVFSVAVPRSFEESSFGPTLIPTDVDVRVYNVRGQLVRTLTVSSELSPVLTMRWDGAYQDGTPVPSGIYFLRVKSGDEEGVRKIVVLR